MSDYQKMYLSLFNDVTDAISKLQQAQQKTEELYMNSKKPDLTTFRGDAGGKMINDMHDGNPRPIEKKLHSHNER